MKLAQLALVFAFFLCLDVVLSTVLTGCGSSGTNPTPSPTPAPTPGTVTVSATELALIQTGSTVATGAVLNFAVTQPASRTQLANQIYASASALYQASGGTPLTPAALNTLLTSYSVNGLSQYTQYVTATNALYQEYYTKYVTNGSTGVQNFAAIVNAIAQGAEAGASSYATVTAAAASNSSASTWQQEEEAIVRAESPRFKIGSGLRPIFGWHDAYSVQLARE